MLHHYIHNSMHCVLPVLHRYEQQCERVWHSVGTVELAFLSVSLCQLMFRSSTQETCAPAEKAWQTQHNSLWAGGALKQRKWKGDTETKRDNETGAHAERDRKRNMDVGYPSLSGVTQCQQLHLIKNQKKWGEDFIADRARERKLRAPKIKRRGDRECGRKRREQQRKRGGAADRGERFRQGGEIRGFAGAAWTTNDLNGALNPAVAYPDFFSIPLTPSAVQQTAYSTLVPITWREYGSACRENEKREGLAETERWQRMYLILKCRNRSDCVTLSREQR